MFWIRLVGAAFPPESELPQPVTSNPTASAVAVNGIIAFMSLGCGMCVSGESFDRVAQHRFAEVGDVLAEKLVGCLVGLAVGVGRAAGERWVRHRPVETDCSRGRRKRSPCRLRYRDEDIGVFELRDF